MPAQSLRGANWGALEVDATKKVLRMTSTVDVGETILQIPLSKVTQASGNKTELGLTFARQPASDDDIVMTEIRFAVPKTCVGFEEVEDAGKQLLRLVQDQLVGSSGAAAAGGSGGAAAGADAGTKVAVFADVALSQPSGVFNIEMTTTWMVFTDLKKNTTFRLPVSTISRSFSLPVPTGDSTYLVICLTEPVRIGTTQHHNIVLTFRDDLVIPEDTPWEAEISDQAKLDALFGGAEKNLIRPKMTGKVADMVASVVKTVSQKKLLGHQTSEFRGYEHDTLPVVNAQLRSTDGFLFLLREFLLFLHRPATLIAYTDVAEAKFESAGSYSATISVQLSVKKAGGAAGARGAALEKVLFGGIPRKEMLGLDKWFRDKGVAVLNPETAIDVDEDDEEDDESYAEGDSDDEDDDDADSADDDFDDDDDDGGKKKKKEKKSKKDKKDKSDKKEKKDKSDKKEKKDKSDKKEKKDKSDKKEKKDKSDKKRKRDAQE